MMRRTALVLLLVALAACGRGGAKQASVRLSRDTAAQDATTSSTVADGATGAGGVVNGDTPVSSDIPPSPPQPTGRPGSVPPAPPSGNTGGPVYPVPTPPCCKVDRHPQPWQDYTVGLDGRTMTFRYYAGVEPCSVFDSIRADETSSAVTVTIYERNDAPPQTACIEIAKEKHATVVLEAPLDNRKVIDGAKDPGGSVGSPPQPPPPSPPPPPGPPHIEEPTPPSPDANNRRPVGWTDYTVGPDDRTLTLRYWSGVKPCSVYDGIKADEGSSSVTVTVYERSDVPPNTPCVAMAQEKFARVVLTSPLAGRQVLDGAPK